MKKIIQLTLLGFVAIFGLNSCDKTAERAFYDESNPIGYSFYQKTIATEFTVNDNGTYNIPVCRSKATEATSVPLTLTEKTGSFTLASPSASFEVGKYETTVSIKYNFQKLDPTLLYSIVLQLPSDQLSFGADSVLTISGNIKLTWVKAGTGVFTSTFFTSGGAPETWDQDLLQAQESPTLYILPSCYYNGYDLRFTLNADNTITYATQAMGYKDATYGMTSWMMPTATSANQPHKDGKVFYFVPRFTVSAGSFGQFGEKLTLQ